VIRVDNLAPSLERHAPRRAALGVLGGALAALLSRLGIEGGEARKGKKAKQKPKLNAFGCVNVGSRCLGNSANCCSGICEGRKPKKGKKDKSRCVAHSTLDCPAGIDFCQGDDNVCGTGFGRCYQTTGQASFCGSAWACIACTKDTDCEPVAGAGAACIVCPDGCPQTGTNCAAPPSETAPPTEVARRRPDHSLNAQHDAGRMTVWMPHVSINSPAH
jgi:hypothetical protein